MKPIAPNGKEVDMLVGGCFALVAVGVFATFLIGMFVGSTLLK